MKSMNLQLVDDTEEGVPVSDGAAVATGGQGAVSFGRPYKLFALTILILINMSNYMDRFIMSILVEPIKAEFKVSDTQMGLLTGFGFSLAYALLILPVGRLSDLFSRKCILAGAIGLWSVMTALCGAASNYFWLMLARSGVGVGESGLPATHSLTSDIFSPRRRPLALSIIGVGGPIGAMLGFLIGGYVSLHYGWRWAFLAGGIPGLLLAATVALFFREPVRGQSDSGGARDTLPMLDFRATLRLLWGRKAYVHVVAGVTFAAIGLLGPGAWTPAFFMRVHHLQADALGLWLAFQSVGGILGTLIGGWLCARFYRPDGKMLIWVMSAGFLFGGLLSATVYLMPVARYALWLLPINGLFGSLWLGPYFTAQQELAGVRSRSTASSIGLLFFTLVGGGMGPLLVGVVSDAFASLGTATSLRYGVVGTISFCILALVHLLLSLRSVERDMTAARGEAVQDPVA